MHVGYGDFAETEFFAVERSCRSPASHILPLPAPPAGTRELPPPSGVLLFRLPPHAEAAVDGVAVGLSRGLGIVAVPPGQHRVVLHVSGRGASHSISVSPHAILIVTPVAITPSPS